MKFHKKAAIVFLAAFTSVSTAGSSFPVAIYAQETDENWLTPEKISWEGTLYNNRSANLAFDHVFQEGEMGFHSGGGAIGKQLVVDLGKFYQIDKLEYYPRTDGGNGTVTAIDVAWSRDGQNWIEQSITGWAANSDTKTVTVNAYARYVRLIPKQSQGGFFSASEIKILKAEGTAADELGSIDGIEMDESTVSRIREHLGVSKDSDAETFAGFEKLDINLNGRLDAADYQNVLNYVYPHPAIHAEGGRTFYTVDKTAVNAGEEICVTLRTEDLAYAEAISGLFTYSTDDFELVEKNGASITKSPWTAGLEDWSSTQIEGTTGIVNIAYVNANGNSAYFGSHEAASFVLRAKRDVELTDDEHTDLAVNQYSAVFGGG